MTALKANDRSCPISQHVNYFAFAFVTPLSANNYN
jgi:hypothetical protein